MEPFVMHRSDLFIVAICLLVFSPALAFRGLMPKSQLIRSAIVNENEARTESPTQNEGFRKFLRPLVTISPLVVGGAKKVKAAIAKQAGVGWDLYGRVPYDDWLFNTHKLVGKDLLKKSFIEAVREEIPIASANFNRNRAVYTSLVLAKGFVVIISGLAVLGWVVMATRERLRKDKALEMELRGFSTPVAAMYKGKQQLGRKIDGNPDWVDMSRRNQNKAEDEQDEDSDSDAEEEGRDDGEQDGNRGKNGEDARDADDSDDGGEGKRGKGPERGPGPQGPSRRPPLGGGGNSQRKPPSTPSTPPKGGAGGSRAPDRPTGKEGSGKGTSKDSGSSGTKGGKPKGSGGGSDGGSGGKGGPGKDRDRGKGGGGKGKGGDDDFSDLYD